MSSVALALTTESSNDNTIRSFFNRDRVGRCCVSTIFTSLSPSTCSELGLGLSKLFGWSVVLGQICQHSHIFQKYWGNQCGQAVAPIHRFIHHCQYWHCHILQISLELLHHGFPCHADALTRHWRCSIFLLLLQEHPSLFFKTRNALDAFSTFVSHNKWGPGPMVASSWWHLPVATIGACFNVRPSLLLAAQ